MRPQNRHLTLALALALTLLALGALSVFLLRPAPAPLAQSPAPVSHPPESVSVPAPTTVEAVAGFHWGNARNSAHWNGTGFFSRHASAEFARTIAPADRPYLITLQSRAFLPLPGLDSAQSILNPDPVAPQTLYLQFKHHLDEPQRDALRAAGLELLEYLDGRAWVVRAPAAPLRDLLRRGVARAAAAIDPRDKLNPRVFAQRVPAYARLDTGAVAFNVITAPGVQAADFAALNPQPLPPSALGPRFRLEADFDTVAALAEVEAVRYIGYGTPPAVSRDGVLDESSNVVDVRDAAPNLSGAGVKVAVREIGRPAIHQDMTGQLELAESTGEASSSEIRHSSAVGGVIAAKGVTSPDAKGVAPGSKVLMYALNDDPFGPSDIVDAGKRGARISNHSYGPAQLDIWGDYDPISADNDAAIRENDLLGFYAGNEETGGIFKHIDFYCGAKNTVCVTMNTTAAHAGDASPAVTPKDGISPFAEHGPMNDGRIKPDLTAFGDGIKLILGLNETYTSIGTSFSCPGISGMTALLFEHYSKVVGREPSAALAKAILLNSASDVGLAGPDSKNGFGIANIESAVALVSARQSEMITTMAEGVARTDSNIALTLNVAGGAPLRVTLCWMDPAGNPAAAKALVNDLDLELVSPSAVTFFPFSLNPLSPEAAATASGANTVDNVEQTFVASPEPGTWTLRVKGTSVAKGPQPYALAVSGGTLTLDTVAVVNASPTSGAAPLAVSFSTTGSSGTILTYTWDFGDGTSQTGADLATIAHTYSTPGVYLATVTLNGSASDGVVIRVNKTTTPATVKSAKATLSFKSPVGFEDDQFAFSLKAPGLIEDKETVKAKLKSGAYAGTRIFINLGGGADRSPEPLRVFTVELDDRAQARAESNSLKYNPKTGEIKVSVKDASLEDIFSALGMTRDPATNGRYDLPIEVETDSTIYRTVVPVDYKATTRSGTIRQARL